MKWLSKLLGFLGKDDPEKPKPTVIEKPCPAKVIMQVQETVPPTPKKMANVQVSKPTPFSELCEQFSPLSHNEHLFLDPNYSPGSLMPCADFSQWISGRLAANDWPSIKKLLNEIAYENTITALQKTFTSYSYDHLIIGPIELLFELKAISMLIYRIPWTGHKDSQISLHAELIKQSLGSYDFSVDETKIEHLQRGANALIRKRNKEMEASGSTIKQETIKINELRELKKHEATDFGKQLSTKPVTFRASLLYSVERGSPVPGTVKPQLQGHYGLRQFGLSDQINRECFSDESLFSPPSDISELAKRLTKDELFGIGSEVGFEVKKSWKKDALINAIMESRQAVERLKQFASRDLVQIHPDIQESFGMWLEDVKLLSNLSLCLATA